MAVNSTSSTSSNYKGVAGLATGIDTDKWVSDLMKAERIPLEKLYQKRQISVWKQEAYRDIISDVRTLKDEYFNVIKPTTNMTSPSTYRQFAFASVDSDAVTAGADDVTAIATGETTIKISKLASAGSASSVALGTSLQGTQLLGDADAAALSAKTFKITLDGVTKEITIGAVADQASLLTDVQTSLDNAFGAGKVTIDVTNPGDGDDTNDYLKLSVGAGSTQVILESGTTDDALTGMGFNNRDSNRVGTSATLQEIAAINPACGLSFVDDKVSFTINSRTFEFDATDTLSTVITTINSDALAGAKASYDELTDKFTLTATQLGKGQNIEIGDVSGTFFDGVSASTESYSQGEDSEVYVNGSATPIVRSTNSLVVNGIKYYLKKADNVSHTITTTANSDVTVAAIKTFFEKYNEFVDKVNTKLSDKYDSSYQPLSDEQKAAMSETQIAAWEEKAKTGLLRNDRMLGSILSDMRRAISDPITDVSGTVFDIGISTGSYFDKGKITIDENKLKTAIDSYPDKVLNLFAKKSTTYPIFFRSYGTTELSKRYDEEGLINRLSDIIEKNISISLDSNDKKGYLIEKAGVVNDASEINNTLYHELYDYNSRIADMEQRNIQKEDSYHKKFTAMEAALSRMNSQSAQLSSMLGK